MNQPIPAYLGPSALAPNEERIYRIRLDRWIGYARAEAALAALEELMTCPQRTRMPNLMLVGVTNNGKSMIVEKFYRRYAIDEEGRLLDSPISTPVLKVQMPSAPDEKRFFGTLLAPLGVSDRLNERLPARQGTVLKLMRAARVRILIIDELHNVLAGPRVQQRRFLNLLRWLGNELRIPLVAVGTAEALRAVQSDDQLANRFAPFALPLWQMGAEYVRLLNTLEVVLPLRRASGLAQAALARKIMSLAEGILGEMITVVRAAAIHAITSGEERITLRTLDQLTFIAPSQRRYAAE